MFYFVLNQHSLAAAPLSAKLQSMKMQQQILELMEENIHEFDCAAAHIEAEADIERLSQFFASEADILSTEICSLGSTLYAPAVILFPK